MSRSSAAFYNLKSEIHGTRSHRRAAATISCAVNALIRTLSFRGAKRRGICCPLPRPTTEYIDVHRYTSPLERPHQPDRHPRRRTDRHPPLRRKPLRRTPPFSSAFLCALYGERL